MLTNKDLISGILFVFFSKMSKAKKNEKSKKKAKSKKKGKKDDVTSLDTSTGDKGVTIKSKDKSAKKSAKGSKGKKSKDGNEGLEKLIVFIQIGKIRDRNILRIFLFHKISL